MRDLVVGTAAGTPDSVTATPFWVNRNKPAPTGVRVPGSGVNLAQPTVSPEDVPSVSKNVTPPDDGSVRSAIGILVMSVSPRRFVVSLKATRDSAWSPEISREPNLVATGKSAGKLKSSCGSSRPIGPRVLLK